MKHLPLISLATLSFLLGTATGTPAQMAHEASTNKPSQDQASQFQRVDQPLWVKAAVTAGGFGLIGLELWWFLFSQPKPYPAKTRGNV